MSTLLSMSRTELSRLEVIQRVCRKTLTQAQASEILSLSLRQVKRLSKAYLAAGAASLVSRRRGHRSNNRLPAEVIARASELLCANYYDFDPTLAHEKLVEVHGLGYLRRDPDASGYNFWLSKLDQFGGNFVQAEMVKAFLNSDEYRKRFGQ